MFDTAERREVLRVPGQRPALSGNGRWLATIDAAGVIRVWEVPARPPWSHMLGLAVALAVMSAVAVVAAVRFGRWCWQRRWRRWVFGGVTGLVLLAVGLLWWDEAAAERGGAELHAGWCQLHRGERISEPELTAMFGRPPVVVPADDGRPGVRHRWTAWLGRYVEVEFGSDGTKGPVCIHDGKSLGDCIARWLGL